MPKVVHILSKKVEKVHLWSKSGFLSWKTTENHLLGWLTLYRLVWVEFYRYEKVQKEVLSKSTFSDAQYNKSKSIFILAKKR